MANLLHTITKRFGKAERGVEWAVSETIMQVGSATVEKFKRRVTSGRMHPNAIGKHHRVQMKVPILRLFMAVLL